MARRSKARRKSGGRDWAVVLRWVLRTIPFVALLIVLALALAGRSVGPAAPGMLSRWDEALGLKSARPIASVDERFPKRALAEDPVPRCFKDRLDRLDLLRADIERLEGERGGSPVAGRWNGFDKSVLKPLQGKYLSEQGGTWTHGEGIQISSCDDLICILDAIYERGDASASALKTYWWYLRTGYVLSTTTRFPEISFSKADRLQMLFKPKELDGFQRLSWLLPERMRYMTTLHTLHRFPPGIVAKGWTASGTCGNANSNGYVRLSDGCLEFWGGVNRLDVPFYQLVTHEIAHRLDVLMSGSADLYLSETDTWKDLSGWQKETILNPGTQEAESYNSLRGWEYEWRADPKDPKAPHQRVRVRKTDPSFDDFVRDYAASDPNEDFADALGWYRTEPKLIWERSPRKAAWLREHVFGGRSFDENGLFDFYETQSVSAVRSELPALVQGCVAGDKPPAAPPRGAPELRLVGVPAPLADCIYRNVYDRIAAAFERLRATEFEACDFLNDTREPSLRLRVFERLTAEVQAVVSRQDTLGPAVRASRALRELLPVELDPREAYLFCHGREDAGSCYLEALNKGFEQVAQPYAGDLGAELETERKAYVAANGFDAARTRVFEYFRYVFAGVDPLLTASAHARWKSCIGAPEPPVGEPVRTEPFSAGTQYVSGGMLNCINAAAVSDVEGIRDRYLSRFGVSVSNPNAQRIVVEVLVLAYKAVLDARVRQEATAEAELRAQRRSNVVDGVVGELIGNLDWLKTATTPANAFAACQPAAERRFDVYTARLGPSHAIPTRFVSYAEVRRDWGRAACERAVSSPVAARRINKNLETERIQDGQAWNTARASIEAHFKARADEQASSCIQAHPQATAGARARRSRCLAAKWDAIEQGAMLDWDKSAEGDRFKRRRVEVWDWMMSRRGSWHSAAEKRMHSQVKR